MRHDYERLVGIVIMLNQLCLDSGHFFLVWFEELGGRAGMSLSDGTGFRGLF